MVSDLCYTVKKEKDGTDMKDKIQAFEKYLQNAEKAKATISKYMRDVKKFEDFVKTKTLNKETLLAYKNHLCQNYAPASVNAILASLNCFLEFMGLCELKMKSLKIQKKIFASPETELFKSEYEMLVRTARDTKNERLFLLLQTVCSTGIRISELSYITVETVRAGMANIRCKGKCRDVFLPKRLCEMLKAYMKKKNIKSGPVFITRNGKPLDRSNIWSAMKKLCKKAGVSEKKVFPHNLRHLFARTYYAREKDVVKLADILGHSNVNTTRIYTMESGATHRKQIEALGFLELGRDCFFAREVRHIWHTKKKRRKKAKK